MPFASHFGMSSGIFVVCNSVWVSTLCFVVKIFSQKLRSLRSPRDFRLCNFFSEDFTSFNSMFFHSCCSVSFIFSFSLLIYSTSSLWFFVHCSRFFQNFSTSFVEERLFDFDRLFSHLPVEFLCKCLKCYSACTISSFFQIF